MRYVDVRQKLHPQHRFPHHQIVAHKANALALPYSRVKCKNFDASHHPFNFPGQGPPHRTTLSMLITTIAPQQKHTARIWPT